MLPTSKIYSFLHVRKSSIGLMLYSKHTRRLDIHQYNNYGHSVIGRKSAHILKVMKIQSRSVIIRGHVEHSSSTASHWKQHISFQYIVHILAVSWNSLWLCQIRYKLQILHCLRNLNGYNEATSKRVTESTQFATFSLFSYSLSVCIWLDQDHCNPHQSYLLPFCCIRARLQLHVIKRHIKETISSHSYPHVFDTAHITCLLTLQMQSYMTYTLLMCCKTHQDQTILFTYKIFMLVFS